MRRSRLLRVALPLAIGAGLTVGVPAVCAAPAAGAAPAQEQQAGTVTVARGTFTNSAKYTGRGNVTITSRAGVRTVRVARNFVADPGSIRLRAYLATDASGATHVDLGPMAETGAQTFRVPRGVNLTRYRYLISWCAAVDEPITQARLVPVRR